MLAGGDCTDDADLLRCGQTSSVLGHRVMAPSTLGTFLRAFTFGHVRQLDRLTETVLARAWAAGAGPRGAADQRCRPQRESAGAPPEVMQGMDQERARALLGEPSAGATSDIGGRRPRPCRSRRRGFRGPRRRRRPADLGGDRRGGRPTAHKPVGGAAAGRGPPGCGHLWPLGAERPSDP
jgi:hypothetical protein